jgi:hypothetical protein
VTDNATTNECSDYDSGHERAHQRFCAFAMKVVIVALLVLVASLPVARTVVNPIETRSFGALAPRQSGGSQLAAYNVPHLPYEGALGKRKRKKEQAFFGSDVLIDAHRGRTSRLLESAT